MELLYRAVCDRCKLPLETKFSYLPDRYPDLSALTPYQTLCAPCVQIVAVEISEGKWCINPPGTLRSLCFPERV